MRYVAKLKGTFPASAIRDRTHPALCQYVVHLSTKNTKTYPRNTRFFSSLWRNIETWLLTYTHAYVWSDAHGGTYQQIIHSAYDQGIHVLVNESLCTLKTFMSSGF